MLQTIRDGSQGWITWTIVGLISLTFIAIGAGSYMGGQSADQVITKVGSTKITKGEIDKLSKRLMNQYGQQAQAGRAMPDIKQIKEEALKALMDNTSLVNAALKQGLTVSNQQVVHFIHTFPDFQENGQFSLEKYQHVLSQIDYSDFEFRKEIQNAMLIDQLRQGFRQTALILPEDVLTAVKFEDQKRDFGFMIIPNKIFEKEIVLSEPEIDAYYKAHLNEFLTSAKVKVEYLELKLSDIDNQDEDAFANKADELIKLAYEHSDSLAPVADKLGLTMKQSAFLTIPTDTNLGADNLAPFNHPKVIAAAFSEESLSKINTDVIQIDPEHYIVLHLLENQPPQQKALATVKTEIEQRLRFQAAAKKSEALASALLAQIKKGADPKTLVLAKPYHLQWEFVKEVTRANTSVPLQIMEAAFHLPKPISNKIFANKLILNNDYQAIVLINKVTDGDLKTVDDQRRIVLEEQLSNHFGQVEFEFFARAALDNINNNIKKPAKTQDPA